LNTGLEYAPILFTGCYTLHNFLIEEGNTSKDE
jgi:hypothetical protein